MLGNLEHQDIHIRAKLKISSQSHCDRKLIMVPIS